MDYDSLAIEKLVLSEIWPIHQAFCGGGNIRRSEWPENKKPKTEAEWLMAAFDKCSITDYIQYARHEYAGDQLTGISMRVLGGDWNTFTLRIESQHGSRTTEYNKLKHAKEGQLMAHWVIQSYLNEQGELTSSAAISTPKLRAYINHCALPERRSKDNVLFGYVPFRQVQDWCTLQYGPGLHVHIWD